jgi:hypothetical protein
VSEAQGSTPPRTLKLQGGTTAEATGVKGTAMQFNGTDGYASTDLSQSTPRRDSPSPRGRSSTSSPPSRSWWPRSRATPRLGSSCTTHRLQAGSSASTRRTPLMRPSPRGPADQGGPPTVSPRFTFQLTPLDTTARQEAPSRCFRARCRAVLVSGRRGRPRGPYRGRSSTC